MSEKIFSGKNSKDFWEAVNRATNRTFGKNKKIIYDYGCKAQEIEQQRDDLLEALKELHTQEGVTAVGPHNTGSRPDICYVCAAIAKCEA